MAGKDNDRGQEDEGKGQTATNAKADVADTSMHDRPPLPPLEPGGLKEDVINGDGLLQDRSAEEIK